MQRYGQIAGWGKYIPPTAVRRVKNISWQLRRQVSAALMAALLPLYARAVKRRR